MDRPRLLWALAGLGQEAQAIAADSTLVPALRRAGLLLPARASALEQALAAGQVLDPVQVLPYLTSRSQLFARPTYPVALGPYLRRLYADVARLLPEVAYTDFHYRVEVPPDFRPCRGGCPDNRDPIVRFRVQGKRYAHRCSVWLEESPDGRRQYSVDQDAFYAIFNQVLADQASPYRVVNVVSSVSKYTLLPTSQFALWVVTPAQARALDAPHKTFTRLCQGFVDTTYAVPKW
ncbi:hypothetical protein [Hymenobacter sp. HDW8]|uniref:hypothetical protein n=1 Tax=Hymenobacter sp. HDW8 TaxID=2714932 RepID=UPI00140997E7|nr:hypothetical protein [Hymenobacter sp. HDW8]QIL78364.1 hypothetical protein G7064_21350 [Hymenobacter sp. HDW8]